MGQILIAGQTGEMFVEISITFFFSLAAQLLTFLLIISKYLYGYVNQGNKNDRKPFFFFSLQLLSSKFNVLLLIMVTLNSQ